MEKTITPPNFSDFETNKNDSAVIPSTQQPLLPKKQTIENILNYSKALSIKKSKNIEQIELVLN
jgi:hypothetical protein